MNTMQNTKQHSSDYNLLVAHKSGDPLPRLNFNLKEWELAELTTKHRALYSDCVVNQLNIYFPLEISDSLNNEVEIPTFYANKVHYYKVSLEEVLNPGTIIYNYNRFIKQFYNTELGEICRKLNDCTEVVLLAHSVSYMLKVTKDAYNLLIKLFENESLFTELYKNSCDEVIYRELDQVFDLWETGLCNVINHVKDDKVGEELDIMVSKYCSGEEYFKNNQGFLRHYDTQHINLPECIEACKVRLELIDLLEEDLND